MPDSYDDTVLLVISAEFLRIYVIKMWIEKYRYVLSRLYGHGCAIILGEVSFSESEGWLAAA